MARGQRKTIEDKIREKQEIIDKLRTRMEKEEDELETLYQQKREMYYRNTVQMMEEAELSETEASEAIRFYIENRETVEV